MWEQVQPADRSTSMKVGDLVSIALPSLIFHNGVHLDPSAIGMIVAESGRDQFVVHFPTGPAQVSRFILKPAADSQNKKEPQ